ADPWKTYDPADPAASDLPAVDHRAGMWVKTTAATALPTAGTPPATTTIELCEGWNLIGFPAAEPRHPHAALASIAGKWQRIFAYDAFDPEDPWEYFDPTVPDWANDLRLMVPGRGYWVLASEAVTLEIANEDAPPFVEIQAPAVTDRVTTFADVSGTVRSRILDHWELRYRPAGGSGWTTFATGFAPVESGALDELDPTVLKNGPYEVELRAFDVQDRSASTSVFVIVDGGLKLGNFTLFLLDVELDLIGLAVSVMRTYDSRDRSVGDFGAGWRLTVNDANVFENTTPGLGWSGTVDPTGLRTYCVEPTEPHIVTVVLPGDEVFRFRPTPVPQCQVAAPPQAVTVEYVPLQGTLAELVPLTHGQEALVVGGFPGPIELWDQGGVRIHDADEYELRTLDGKTFRLSQGDGLLQIGDRRGNFVAFSDVGIDHSSGVGLEFLRDGLGRITSIEDLLGQTISYEYDAAGDLVSVTDQANQVTRFTYLEDHYLHKIILPPDNQAILAADYGADGRLKRTCRAETCWTRSNDPTVRQETWTTPTGLEKRLTYDDLGNVVAVSSVGSEETRTTTYEYNAMGDPTEITDPTGAVTSLSYDGRRNLTRTVRPYPEGASPDDYTTTVTYNSRNQQETVSYPTGVTHFFDYDPATGDLLTIRDSRGIVHQNNVYRADGLLASEEHPYGTFTYEEYDPRGNPTRIVDPSGDVLAGVYDAMSQLTSMSVNGEETFGFTYDGVGRQKTADYGDGVEVSFEYDRGDMWRQATFSQYGTVKRILDNGRFAGWEAYGRPSVSYEYDDDPGQAVTQRSPTGRVRRSEYDEFGSTSSVTLENLGVIRFERDAGTRPVAITNPLDETTELEYERDNTLRRVTNARGKSWDFEVRPLSQSVTDPLGHTTTTLLDNRRLPFKTVYPDGKERTVTYLVDAPVGEGRDYVASITDEAGRRRSFAYDSDQRMSGATDLAEELYSYAPFGGTSTVQTPEGAVLTFIDGEDFEELEYGDGGTTRLNYSRGDLISKILPSGDRFDVVYDVFGRRQTRTDSATGEVQRFEWNDEGELEKSIGNLGTSKNGYGPTGALRFLESTDGSRIDFGRDLLDRVTSVTTTSADGTASYVTSYTYDAGGNLETIVDPILGTTTREYDDANRLQLETRPNGIVTDYDYDSRDRITRVEHRTGSGAVIASFDYLRSATGEPERVTREDESFVTFGYDGALRLTRESYHDIDGTLIDEITYTYDRDGKRLKRLDGLGTSTYAWDPGFQLATVTGASSESYAYDADGRVSAIQRADADLELDHDTYDQLISVRDQAAGWQVDYGYDAMGRRVRAEDGAGLRHYQMAPAMGGGLALPHLVSDSQGQVISGYVFAGDQPFMRLTPTGGEYYLRDALGNVVAKTDPSGSVVATFSYGAFGTLRSTTGSDPTASAAGGDFRFHGAWLEQQTGIYRMGVRDYDPGSGLFLSRDPLGFVYQRPETAHLYQFASANPVLFIDPTGLFSLMSVNVTVSSQNLLGAVKTWAVNEARETVREAIREFIAEQVVRWIVGLAPIDLKGLDALEIVAENVEDEVDSVWQEVEHGVNTVLCWVFGDSGTIWFEPAIDRANRARIDSDGFGCPATTKISGHDGGHNYPDFYVTTNPPPTTNRGLILGESKIQISRFYEKWILESAEKRTERQFAGYLLHARKQMFTPGFIVMVAGARGGVLPTTLTNISMMQQRINKEIVSVGVVGLWVILKEGRAGKRWKKRKRR
ncbi:MAG: RHS repeat protein, partial [Actinomycetia bacterium]|nr:RHS repeat protein [Actinomycetes bacterium]